MTNAVGESKAIADHLETILAVLVLSSSVGTSECWELPDKGISSVTPSAREVGLSVGGSAAPASGKAPIEGF